MAVPNLSPPSLSSVSRPAAVLFYHQIQQTSSGIFIMLNHHNDVFSRSQNPARNMAPLDKGLRGGQGSMFITEPPVIKETSRNGADVSRKSVVKPRASSVDRHAFISRLIYMQLRMCVLLQRCHDVYQQARCKCVQTKCLGVNCDVKSI